MSRTKQRKVSHAKREASNATAKRGERRNGKKREEEVKTTQQERGKDTAADNDIKWWSKNPQMLADAASLPFSQSLGTAVVVPAAEMVNRKDDRALPGLMTLNFVPSIGLAIDKGDLSSPINLAAAAQYTAMRAHNSGATNYDSPALMFYFLTMDGIYMYYSYMVRIYGAMRLFSQKNRYLPRLIVEANGVDYDDIELHLAQFRYYINQFAARASAFCVPANMDLYERHFWLCQHVFTDDNTSKSQMYMFVPAAFPRYFGIHNKQATIALEFPLRDSTKRKLTDLITFGDSLLNSVLTDQDFNTMSGDMLRTYGDNNLFRLAPIVEDYVLSPVYSEEVLSQIHNATVLGIPSPEFNTQISGETQAMWDENKLWTNSWKIGNTEGANPSPYIFGLQNLDEIYYPSGGTLNSTRGGRFSILTTDQLLNSHYDVVSPADVMEMTRLKVAGFTRAAWGSPTWREVLACYGGSEFIANARVYYANFTYDEATGKAVPTFEFEPFMTVMSKAEFAAAARFLIFKDHPIVTLVDKVKTQATDMSNMTIVGFIGDLDNYTLISPETLKRIHETALMSALDVPMIGTF